MNVGTRIAVLTLVGLLAPYANAQRTPVKQRTQELPSPTPRSGVLVGLTSGQTLWIAPAAGKIQVLAAPDYIIPRKDGFWRVRLAFNWRFGNSDDDPAVLGVPEGRARLWAVPLSKGMNALPWLEPQPGTNANGAQTEQEQENVEDMEPECSEGHDETSLLFLSPDYLSYLEDKTQCSSGGGTRRDVDYHILRITDPPSTSVKPGSLLFVEEIPVPDSISSDTRASACSDSKGELSEKEEEWSLDQEEGHSYGIERGVHQWVYASLFGYESWCALSSQPPRSVVGANELFPDWKQIKSAFPAAQDAFSSPAHDLLLVVTKAKLIVAPVRGGKIKKALGETALSGKPVMVQWAIGRYVDAWTKELTPYFAPYRM